MGLGTVSMLAIATLAVVEPASVAAPGGEEGGGAARAPAASSAAHVVGPWLWVRQQVAVAGWPAGLISDTRLQVRGPLLRTPSIVFQDTYAGAGARLAVTPAFLSVGPQLSLAPIDVFDIDLRAGFVLFWPSSSGLLPYWDLDESTRDLDRQERFDDPATTAATSTAFTVTAAPTLKLKAGPVIAFSGWSFSVYWIRRPEGVDAPLVYEPFTDRRLAWTDLVVDHQSAVVGEILDGDGGPLLWIGGTFHDVMTLHSDDRSISAGGLVVLRPSCRRGWPRFIVQVLPYLMDPDRVGGVPRMALAVVWSGDTPLRSAASSIP